MRALCVALLLGGAAFARTPEDCTALRYHGKVAEADACFTALSQEEDPYRAAEGLWGLRQYGEANNRFRDAVKMHPDNAKIRVRWARLLLERFNPRDASGLFAEALKIEDKYAPAYVGLALVASQ